MTHSAFRKSASLSSEQTGAVVSGCLRVDDLCRGQPGVSACLREGDTREVNQSATPPTNTELASTSHTSFDNGRMNDIMFTA